MLRLQHIEIYFYLAVSCPHSKHRSGKCGNYLFMLCIYVYFKRCTCFFCGKCCNSLAIIRFKKLRTRCYISNMFVFLYIICCYIQQAISYSYSAVTTVSLMIGPVSHSVSRIYTEGSLPGRTESACL